MRATIMIEMEIVEGRKFALRQRFKYSVKGNGKRILILHYRRRSRAGGIFILSLIIMPQEKLRTSGPYFIVIMS
jgi:hypothetical protein